MDILRRLIQFLDYIRSEELKSIIRWKIIEYRLMMIVRDKYKDNKGYEEASKDDMENS